MKSFKEFLGEAISYALSASNFAAGGYKSPYKGQSTHPIEKLGGKQDYHSIKSFLTSRGIDAEVGTSDRYKTATLSSKTMTSDEMLKKLK